MNVMQLHPVYAINLDIRTDRNEHILNQFKGRIEFDFSLIVTSRQEFGNIGLMYNIIDIIRIARERNLPYVIICEDDHLFTEKYDPGLLTQAIMEARGLNANLLLGGVSSQSNAIRATASMFWVERFTGLQFTVVFRSSYRRILNIKPKRELIPDMMLSALFGNKFVICPFISVQKEFLYSDVTSGNERKGYVRDLFRAASHSLAERTRITAELRQLIHASEKEIPVVKRYFRLLLREMARLSPSMNNGMLSVVFNEELHAIVNLNHWRDNEQARLPAEVVSLIVIDNKSTIGENLERLYSEIKLIALAFLTGAQSFNINPAKWDNLIQLSARFQIAMNVSSPQLFILFPANFDKDTKLTDWLAAAKNRRYREEQLQNNVITYQQSLDPDSLPGSEYLESAKRLRQMQKKYTQWS